MDEALKVLEARDNRVEKIEQLLYKGSIIVSLRVNYPGNDKDNALTRSVVEIIRPLIKAKCEVVEEYYLNEGEGPVYIFVAKSQEGSYIKDSMIRIEEDHPIGRLVDIDVYFKELRSISRKELGHPSRRCYLCNEDAFICIRNQNHSLNEILLHMRRTLDNYEQRGFNIRSN